MNYIVGVEGLEDKLIMPPGTVVTIEGPPGSGKSFVALATAIKNIEARGSGALYISLAETRDKIIKRAESVALPLSKYIREGKTEIVQLPVLSGEDLVDYITDLVVEKGPGGWADIVIIDNATAVLKTLREYDRQRAWLQSVLYTFTTKEKGLLILISESGAPVETEQNILEFVADVVLELGMRANPKCPIRVLDRYMLVKKHRFAPVTDAPYLIEIKKGVRALGHVSSSQATEIRSMKRPIPIKCPRLAEVIGDELPPGTSVLIINRRPGLIRTNHRLGLINYLGTQAVREGMNVAVFTLSSKYFNEMMKKIKEKEVTASAYVPTFVHLDPGKTHPKYFLNIEHSLAMDSGVDVIFTAQFERVLDVVGMECLVPYLNLRHSLLMNLGVTSITIYNLRNPANYPYLLAMWSDIVVELDVDEEGIYYEIKESLKPNITVRRIHEKTIRECIESEFSSDNNADEEK